MKEVGRCCLYMWARVSEAISRESRRDTPDITFCQSARPMWGWSRSITCQRSQVKRSIAQTSIHLHFQKIGGKGEKGDRLNWDSNPMSATS